MTLLDQLTGPSRDAAEAILRTISDEVLHSGDKIGSERELSERFDVSRWHIRKAISALESEGTILQTFGRSGGIFVAPKRLVRDAQPLLGVPEFLRAQGVIAGTTVLESKLAPAEEETVKKLGLSANDWVLVIKRIRVADGIPLSFETNSFPANLFPDLQNKNLSGSIYELMESDYNIFRGEADESILARAASPHEANLLQLASDSPVLVIRRVARTLSDVPFEFSEEVYRPDRISINMKTHGMHQPTKQLDATVNFVRGAELNRSNDEL